MNKFIVYKNDDGRLIFQSFNASFLEGKTDSDLLDSFADQRFSNLQKFVFNSCGREPQVHTGDCCDFPASDSLWCLYLNDQNQLVADNNYEIQLMPEGDIFRKHKERMQLKILEELEKQSPSMGDIVRWEYSIVNLHRQIKRGGTGINKSFYEQALENLDERVGKGESDKPIIRQKLQAKIQELS